MSHRDIILSGKFCWATFQRYRPEADSNNASRKRASRDRRRHLEPRPAFVEVRTYSRTSRRRASPDGGNDNEGGQGLGEVSKSLARRRLRPNRGKLRYTNQRRGRISGLSTNAPIAASQSIIDASCRGIIAEQVKDLRERAFRFGYRAHDSRISERRGISRIARSSPMRNTGCWRIRIGSGSTNLPKLRPGF
jgi:hypothetical protein